MPEWEEECSQESLWAWVVRQPDGELGVVATLHPGIQMMAPLVSNSRARAERNRELAQAIAKASGKQVRLVRFRYVETWETLGEERGT